MIKASLLPSRAVMAITGPDARTFLQGVVSQNVEKVAPGSAVFSTLLSPQGKILADFIIYAGDTGFVIDCPHSMSGSLRKTMTLYRMRADVAIEMPDDWAVAAIGGSRQTAMPHDLVIFDDPRSVALGQRAAGPRAVVEELVDEFGGDAGEDAYDRERIGAGIAEGGKDFTENEVFVTDVNYDLLNAVDYKKGCFIGQEVSSRMMRKGAIRKRTLGLEFEGEALERGAAVTSAEATLGKCLSSIDGSALALIRIDRLRAAGTALEVGGRQVRLVVPHGLDLA